MTLLKDPQNRRTATLPRSLLSINEKRVSLTRGRRLVWPVKRRNTRILAISFLSSHSLPLSLSFSACPFGPSFGLPLSRLRLLNRSTQGHEAVELRDHEGGRWIDFSYCTNFYDLYSPKPRPTLQPIRPTIRKEAYPNVWRDAGKFERPCIDREPLPTSSQLRNQKAIPTEERTGLFRVTIN